MARPEQELRLGLGNAALEFVATLAGRFDQPVERLRTPRDLERWLDRAGIAARARCDESLLDEARALREAIYRVLDATRGGGRPRPDDVALVNAWARRPRPAPQIGRGLALAGAGPDPARAALAQVACAAVELVTGPDLPRVRNCASPGCSLLFIDHSRPGRRRWCSMERCGNRAKTARYRRRRGPAARR